MNPRHLPYPSIGKPVEILMRPYLPPAKPIELPRLPFPIDFGESWWQVPKQEDSTAPSADDWTNIHAIHIEPKTGEAT